MSSARAETEQYLGDGVSAAFDDEVELGVWLTAEDGIPGHRQTIYLEPAVFQALESFMANARGRQPLDLDAIRNYPGPALLARCLDMIEEALENILPKEYAVMYRKMISDQVVAQAEAALARRRQEREMPCKRPT